MRIIRILGSFLVLIPFLFSVSGILVIQSHCSCTGKNQVSLYLPPETCADILNDHNHLFTYHAADLTECCDQVIHHNSCDHEDGCGGCGCDSPEARFYQVDHKFTDEKVSINKVMVSKYLDEVIYTQLKVYDPHDNLITTSWFDDPPPLISSSDLYIYILCQIKIPHIA
jgi:hypothetical protein